MVSETSSYHGYPICRLVGPSNERALGEYDRKRGHESSFVESLCTFEVTPSPPTPLLPPPAGMATGALRYMWHWGQGRATARIFLPRGMFSIHATQYSTSH